MWLLHTITKHDVTIRCPEAAPPSLTRRELSGAVWKIYLDREKYFGSLSRAKSDGRLSMRFAFPAISFPVLLSKQPSVNWGERRSPRRHEKLWQGGNDFSFFFWLLCRFVSEIKMIPLFWRGNSFGALGQSKRRARYPIIILCSLPAMKGSRRGPFQPTFSNINFQSPNLSPAGGTERGVPVARNIQGGNFGSSSRLYF